MKQGIHPEYMVTKVTCSCGNTFTTRSIKAEMHVELCNQCHPFYTGKQKLVDTGGRVERFERKYKRARTGSAPSPAPAPGSAMGAPSPTPQPEEASPEQAEQE